MADSDDNEEDSLENELEVFQDEIKSTLCSSLSDKTTFRSLIAEVEHLRNAYKQDPASLNKAVLKALFDLPFSTTSHPLTLNAYFKRMGELFEQYSPLIKSLKRDKKTQQEGGIAVAEPLIQLLQSGKLPRNEWADGQAKTGLPKLLTQHGIIAESQIAIAVNTIDEVFHIVSTPPPEDVAGSFSAAAMVAKASIAIPAGGGLKRKHTKNLSTGQFSGTFTYAGGKLHQWMSDDFLEIPEGAIPRGEEWTVHGNIHTSLDSFAHLLKKPKGECFIAAINDYRVVGDHQFKKPVKVVVHHSVCDPRELASLCIQLHDDKHGVTDVPYYTKKIVGGPWYEVEGPRILVYTYHFTTITCKICNSQECDVKAIKGQVYGMITQDRENKFFATIEVYLYFMRNVANLPVFSEVFNQEQESAGCKLLKTKVFPPSLRLIARADRISVNLNCTDKEWILLEDSDFQNKEIVVEDYVPCLSDAYDPVCLGTYMLKGSAPILNGNITLSIGGNHVVKLPVAMKLDGATTVDELQVSRPPADWILQDATLYDIAEKFRCGTFYKVGLKLGLTANELDHIEANNSHETIERKTFKMLRKWRDRQPRNGEQELKSKDILCEILSITENNDALELLKQSPKNQAPLTAQELVALTGITDSASSSSRTSDDQLRDRLDNG